MGAPSHKNEKTLLTMLSITLRCRDALPTSTPAPTPSTTLNIPERTTVIPVATNDPGESAILHLDASHVVLPSNVTSPFDNGANCAPIYDVEATSMSCHDDSTESSDMPQAYAALTEPLLRSFCEQPLHTSSTQAVAQPVGYCRPEFLFAKVIKPTVESSCGLFLKNCQGGKVVVSRVSETGLFCKSNIMPGDRVISVNGVSCLALKARQVASLIHAAVHVSIAVHNKEGDPGLVSTSIPKPTPQSKVGFTLKNYRGAIHICRIDTKGLFAGTFLTPGHRCITINDVNCSTLRATSAAQVVADASDIVTIVSEPRQEWAMVLSCDAHRTWWNRMAIGSGVAAGALAAGVLVGMH